MIHCPCQTMKNAFKCENTYTLTHTQSKPKRTNIHSLFYTRFRAYKNIYIIIIFQRLLFYRRSGNEQTKRIGVLWRDAGTITLI